MVAGLLGLDDVLVVERIHGVDPLQLVQRKHDIVGRDRRAVVELCFGPQFEGGGRIILRIADALRDQTIIGRRLVGVRRHQAVKGHVDAGSLHTLVGKRVEGVKSALGELAHGAALRRIGINPVEMFKIGRHLRCADQRYGVMANGVGRRCARGECGEEERCESGKAVGKCNRSHRWSNPSHVAPAISRLQPLAPQRGWPERLCGQSLTFVKPGG